MSISVPGMKGLVPVLLSLGILSFCNGQEVMVVRGMKIRVEL